MDELVEFSPNRRRNSAFSASSRSTRSVSSMTIASRSSYDGCGDSGSTAEDHAMPLCPTTRDTPVTHAEHVLQVGQCGVPRGRGVADDLVGVMQGTSAPLKLEPAG